MRSKAGNRDWKNLRNTLVWPLLPMVNVRAKTGGRCASLSCSPVSYVITKPKGGLDLDSPQHTLA